MTLVGAERIQAIGRDVEVMRTPLRKLGVQEIVQGVYAGQFQPSTRLYPNFGYTNDVLWFRVRLKNTTLDRIERVFDVGSVFLDSVALYESNPGGNFQESWAGGGIFIEQRAMKMRRAAFLLRLKPFEEKTVYVRAVGTLPMIFHFELYPHNDFVALQRQDANFDGMIWGMILCIAIFNVVQYLASQRFVYGLFAIHAITSLLALLSINGVLTEYIWLDVQGFGTRLLEVCISLSNLLSLIYARYFLKAQDSPRFYRIFQVEMLVALLLIVFSFLGWGSFMVASSYTLIVVPTIVALALLLMKESSGAMRLSLVLFAIGWSVCTLSVTAANVLGFVADWGEYWGVRAGGIGAVVQLFMVSVAVAVRTGSSERALHNAQAERTIAERERQQEALRNQELSAANEAIRRQSAQLEEQAQSLKIANLEMEQIAHELIQQRALLQQKNDDLNAASKEKSEILSIAAHDLKNPLTGLKGMLEILRSGDNFKPAYLNQMSLTMQHSVDRMFDIIKNLLDIEALEEGAIKPQYEYFDMVSAVKPLADSYRVPAAKKRLNLDFKANASEVPCFADKQLLLQVGDNIISNAVKYSRLQKNIFIRTLYFPTLVELQEQMLRYDITEMHHLAKFSLEHPFSVLLVQDEGPGFTDADKQRLFQKFARLSAQPTGGEHSTGLGLSISKRLVESMNGVIWCESEPERGARFVVAFGTSIT
ncbi:MAG: sensor histidine kinase [Candidatus Kapabacteria bacterium]|nr:sensor histidine kinase [Candidatus Kapabacteria bacterium]